MSMEFIFSYPFTAGILPFLLIFIHVLVKKSCHQDIDLKFKKEDFNVGFEISLVGLILIINHSIELYSFGYDDQAINPAWTSVMVIGIIFGMWIVTYVVRLQGWKKEKGRLRLNWWGIGLPFVYGSLILLLALNLTTNY